MIAGNWGKHGSYLDLAPLPLNPREEEGMFNLFDLEEQIAEFWQDRQR